MTSLGIETVIWLNELKQQALDAEEEFIVNMCPIRTMEPTEAQIAEATRRLKEIRGEK